MLNDYPEVLHATRVTQMGAWLIRFGENKFNEDGVLFADSTFFDVFDFKLLKGDPENGSCKTPFNDSDRRICKKIFWQSGSDGTKNDC